jgi:putative mRNA 3-end processing factor
MINSNNLRISLDRKEPGSDIDFISHAHTDHLAAAKSSNMVLASEQTIQLIEHARNIKITSNRANSGKFELIEAGHMLGSRQLLMDDAVSGKRITYTGDFQLVGSKTSMPIDVRSTDVLIMDSTYESPKIMFENKYDVETLIQDWTNKMLGKGIVLFSAYAMGKAQELIAVLNEAGIKPVVSKKISKVSAVYKDYGIKLDYCSAYDENSGYGEIIKGNFVGITEARDINMLKACLHFAHNKNVFTAMATGFAKIFRFNTDVQFPLSDHADFRQSVRYIEDTGAREILTYGPNASAFARNLGEEGYNAIPFNTSSFALDIANRECALNGTK